MTSRDAITSTEFRLRYAHLAEPVDVTVLGRVIGTWFPAVVQGGSEPVGTHAPERAGSTPAPATTKATVRAADAAYAKVAAGYRK